MHYSKITNSILILCSCVIISTLSQEMKGMSMCIFSTDSSQYTPNCFNCLEDVYKSTLFACVNATVMPSNISFSAAHCVQDNCMINYPTLPPANDELPNVFEVFSKLLFSGNLLRMKRSVEDNSIDIPNTDLNQPKIKIVQHIKTLATPGELVIGDVDYQG